MPGQFAQRGDVAVVNFAIDGVPGTAMPPWRPLISQSEALWIAQYLKKE